MVGSQNLHKLEAIINILLIWDHDFVSTHLRAQHSFAIKPPPSRLHADIALMYLIRVLVFL